MKKRVWLPVLVLAAICVALAFAPSAENVVSDSSLPLRARVVETDDSRVQLTGLVEYGTQRLVVEMLEGPAKGQTFKAENELRAQLDIDKKFSVGDVPAELLRTHVARALVTNPERPDRVQGMIYGALHGEGAPEFGWNRTQEARHRLSIVVVLDFVGIVGDAVVDGVPDTESLEVHLHDQGPFRIVGPGQHRPRDVRGRPLDDALDDARSGVPVARVVAMGATSTAWRRTRRLDFLLAGAITD